MNPPGTVSGAVKSAGSMRLGPLKNGAFIVKAGVPFFDALGSTKAKRRLPGGGASFSSPLHIMLRR